MTQEIINVGPAPNDGLGDPLRTAFIKTNNNFSQLYSRAQATPPTSNIGTVGDQAGMYAYDSTTFYYCFANYTGNSVIWNTAGGGSGGNGTAILNGNTSVSIPASGSNVTVNVNGAANSAVFDTVGLQLAGIVMQPRTPTANIIIPANTNAQLLGPITIANSIQGYVPATSAFYITG